MEPEYPFSEGQGNPEGQVRQGSAAYYRQSVEVDDPYARRYGRSDGPGEGAVAHFARGVARVFALLFLAAGVGMWMVYFVVMYILGLLGGHAMTPEEVANDLTFGVLSTLIALVLLVWSKSEQM